jgi:DnaJ-class molecular chaperone
MKIIAFVFFFFVPVLISIAQTSPDTNLSLDTCHICEGKGKISVICKTCKGTGKIYCSSCAGGGVIKQYNHFGDSYSSCQRCKGKGLIQCQACEGKKRQVLFCENCKGKGMIKKNKTPDPKSK